MITRDIKEVTEIRKVAILGEITRWLLARSSKLFAVEEACAGIGVTKPTMDNYIEALCALYVFDRIPAWNKTDYDRIGKKPKYFACDPALMANCLD